MKGLRCIGENENLAGDPILGIVAKQTCPVNIADDFAKPGGCAMVVARRGNKTLRDAVLGCFDSEVAPFVVEFGKRLSDATADLFVLMARKAACFLEVLTEANLVCIDGVTTTDRILDMNTNWLKGQRVVLVDDALISGTTLHRTSLALREAGVDDIRTTVFCVDKEWWSKDLARPERPYLSLDNQRTTDFCANIVEAISLVPRPYSVDWPLLRNVRIPIQEFGAVTSLPGWDVVELTTNLQEAHSVSSFTCQPTDHLQHSLAHEIGGALADAIEVAKVRLYVRQILGPRPVHMVNALPIAILSPMAVGDLDRVWETLLGSRLRNPELKRAFMSPTSKLRLVQFLLAAKIGRIWIEGVRSSLETHVQGTVDTARMCYIFPPPLIDAIAALLDENTRFEEPLVQDGYDLGNKGPVSIPLSFESGSYWRAQSALTQPFLDRYLELEIPARRLALKLGTAAFDDARNREVLDRLKTGITVNQLRNLSFGWDPSVRGLSLVSIFIDQAIDKGMIVPINLETNGWVYRAYRHGEDIRFGKAEERLFGLLFAEVLKAYGKDRLPRLTLEKLGVVWLRYGLKKSLFSRWNGLLGEDGTVGVRFDLKGAVVKAGAKGLFDYSPDASLGQLLCDSGIIREDDSKGGYAAGEIPSDVPVREGAEIEAKQVGALLGAALGGKPEVVTRPLSQDDLVLLATCLRPWDIPGALAAEIDVFVRRLERGQEFWVSCLDSAAKATRAARKLRRDAAFEAINSGVWKFRHFSSGTPWKTIESVSGGISDSLYREKWLGLWSDGIEDGLDALDKQITVLVEECGAWLFRANIVLRLLESGLLYVGDVRSGNKPKRVLDDLRRFLKWYHELGMETPKRMENAVDRIGHAFSESDFNVGRFRAYIQAEIAGLVYSGQKILDEIRLVATSLGRPRLIHRFPHVLSMTFDCILGHEANVEEQFLRVLFEERVVAQKSRAKLELVPDGQERAGGGKWVCASGQMALRKLLHLAKRCGDELAPFANVRSVLVAYLPAAEQLLQGDGGSTYDGSLFWRRMRSLPLAGGVTPSSVSVTALVPPSEGAIEGIVSQARAVFGHDCVVSDAVESRSEDPIPMPWSSITVSALGGQRATRGDEMRRADVGVLTVVTEEVQAVVELLQRSEEYRKGPGRKIRRVFYEGTLGSASDTPHKVACTQLLTQGNRSVVSAYDALVNEYHPKVVILCGIAGAIHKDVGLRDVMLATEIVYYDQRKETHEGTRRRGHAYQVPALVQPSVNDFFVEKGEPCVIEYSNGDGASFKVFRGPLGTGEAVVAYRQSDIREWLLDFNDKTLALETEAGGLAQAFWEEGVGGIENTTAYLVVRGISDHADEDKDDAARLDAARNAAKAMEALLGHIPNLSDDSV